MTLFSFSMEAAFFVIMMQIYGFRFMAKSKTAATIMFTYLQSTAFIFSWLKMKRDALVAGIEIEANDFSLTNEMICKFKLCESITLVISN